MNIHVELTNNEIDVNEVVKRCTHPSSGGMCVYIGTTRDFYEDENGIKDVVTLSYESEEELALIEMNNICEEAIAKFRGIRASIVHRLGEVRVEGISIICAISTEHRKEAFEACEFMMKDLKKRVAIWKREIYKEGDSVWKVNKENFEDNVPEKINFMS
jgi:molybdopterin synthase catalytic subunit